MITQFQSKHDYVIEKAAIHFQQVLHTDCQLTTTDIHTLSSCQICHIVCDERKDGGEDRVARTERESYRRRREEN